MHPPAPILAALAILGTLIATPTASSETTSITREAAMSTALHNNRELAVAALEIDRARSQAHWAGRLDNPEIELSASSDQLGLNDDESTIALALSQRFPLTSRLRHEKNLRQRHLDLATIEFRLRQRQLAYEVDQAWITLRSASRLRALDEELLALSQEISLFLQSKVKLGEASALDAAQAKLNTALIAQEFGKARNKVNAASTRLRHLLGLPPGKQISASGETTLPTSAPSTKPDLTTALRNRPDYAALAASGALGQAQLTLALAQRWDDIAVRVFAERERAVDAPDGLEANTFLGIGFSIPLPLRKKNEIAIENAQIEIEKARRMQAAKNFAIHSELAGALQARHDTYLLLKSTQSDALPLAEKNLTDLRTAQQNGQANLIQIQRAQEQLLKLHTSAIELHNTYDLLDAKVRFLSGTYPIPTPK